MRFEDDKREEIQRETEWEWKGVEEGEGKGAGGLEQIKSEQPAASLFTEGYLQH